MKCPHCNQEHPEGTKFCPETGQKMPSLCGCPNPNCVNYMKTDLSSSFKYCPECGTLLSGEETKPTDNAGTTLLELISSVEDAVSKEVEIVQIPAKYKPRKRISEGLMLVENCDHKFGYLNTSMEEVIPCQFCDGGAFLNGIAPVFNDEKWGAIDFNGNIVHPFQYGNMYSIPGYCPKPQPVNEPFYVKNGKVLDKWNNEYSCFNLGIPLFANGYDIYYLDQGVITCYTLEVDLKGFWHHTIKFKKGGFTKKNGFRKDDLHQFYNNLAVIRRNEKYGIINLSLEEIVPCEYDYICNFDLDPHYTIACNNNGTSYLIKVNLKKWNNHSTKDR